MPSKAFVHAPADSGSFGACPIADRRSNGFSSQTVRASRGRRIISQGIRSAPGKISGYDPASRSGAFDHCRSGEAIEHDRCGGKNTSPAGAAANGEPPHAGGTRSPDAWPTQAQPLEVVSHSRTCAVTGVV